MFLKREMRMRSSSISLTKIPEGNVRKNGDYRKKPDHSWELSGMFCKAYVFIPRKFCWDFFFFQLFLDGRVGALKKNLAFPLLSL
jgi:hypothetical protein